MSAFKDDIWSFMDAAVLREAWLGIFGSQGIRAIFFRRVDKDIAFYT